MFNNNLIVLSYHRFVEKESDYRFSRTYEQFRHDIDKKVYDWITIDDGMKCMVKACEMLRERNVRAKLFICTGLIGQRGYCDWEQMKVLSKFHDIENHGHKHLSHVAMSDDDVYQSMATANDLIKKMIGRQPRYFVPPFNQVNDVIEDTAHSLGLTVVKDRENILNISK